MYTGLCIIIWLGLWYYKSGNEPGRREHSQQIAKGIIIWTREMTVAEVEGFGLINSWYV